MIYSFADDAKMFKLWKLLKSLIRRVILSRKHFQGMITL